MQRDLRGHGPPGPVVASADTRPELELSGEGCAPPPALDQVLGEVRACTICEAHLPLGPRPVVQLAEGARILIAGQAPGIRVHASGIPFDDPSGNRLRDWMGLGPAQFYDPALIAILPMGFCYPGTGRSGDLPPRPECAPAWRSRLMNHLPHLQLTLVIGRYAQAWHLPSASKRVTDVVSGWRSRWPELLPLPHPSPRNNRWLKQNPWFEDAVIPALRARVAQLVPSSAGPGNSELTSVPSRS